MRFVLVHGAWHYGALWGPVAKTLIDNGHEVHTPTAGGLGWGNIDRTISNDECCRPIADFILANDLEDFVLVGHSWGGTLIAKLAEAMPERIRRLVFWNAFVPLDGNSLMDEVAPPLAEVFSALAAERDDGAVVLPFAVWRDTFINDASLELARWAYAQLVPQPFRSFTDKLDLAKFYTLEIPRSYINGTEDNSITQGEWGWHPRMSNRLGVFRLVQMPGSHEVIFTNPQLLAEKIVEAGRD
jgi:pimeloyl-ACP methyl ester carboxylesterase